MKFPRKISRISLFLLVVGTLACRQEKEAVLARVGHGVVTAKEFQNEIAGQPPTGNYLNTLPGRKEMLELMVRRKILLAEAERISLSQSLDLKKQLEELDADLERQRQEAKDRLVLGTFFRKLQEGDLKVTEEEARRFWTEENEVRASHILLSDEAKARETRARLDKGESFDKLAKQLSEDPSTATKNGDLGFLLRGSLVPEFENALFALKIGEVSDVVSSPYGFHLIKKLGERKLSEKPYESVQENIRAVLQKQKFQSWIEQARQRYKVSTDLAALQNLSLNEAVPGPLPSTGKNAAQ
jgi:parvulin-like peptidyl-prolyl isomerase